MDTEDELQRWLREAAEETKMPKDKDELAQHIRELRGRLNVIADAYGYNDPNVLLYSRYLDRFIVEFQLRIKVKKEADK